MKIKLGSGAVWEDTVGYSRAVKVGNIIEVAGTTSLKDGAFIHHGNAYLQTKQIISIIEDTLNKLGSSLEDVVRTRIYLKQISDWQEVGKAHGESFNNIKPASTMIAVSEMINPDMLVEIEATAIISNNNV